MRKVKILFLSLLLLSGCASSKEEKQADEPKENEKQEVKEDEIVDVNFMAVGDNLIHNSLYLSAPNRDYSYMYEKTKYLSEAADVAYINLETILGGDELELSNYPMFNGPYEIADGIVSAGYDWLAGSSNHSFDRGEQGIVNELNYLDKYPDISVTGIHRTQEEANQYQIIERNGIKIGILGYTYGLNGFTLPEGKEYLVDLIDKDKIKKDMEAISKLSDVQLVSMHWGEEYSTTPSSEQEELAQFISDQGAEVIIGEHPHVIQPMTYKTGKDGNQTLVIYSLGNYISHQISAENMLGGMAQWTLSYNKTKKTIEIKDVQFLPTITHIYDNQTKFETYVLKDYTDELANQHSLKLDLGEDISRAYFINLTNQIMNDEVPIIYE